MAPRRMVATVKCYRLVSSRGGACLAAARPCSRKVVYVDPKGRGWCITHQPDDETKARWLAIGEMLEST